MYGFPNACLGDDGVVTPNRNAICGRTPSCHVFLSRSCGSGKTWHAAQYVRASCSPFADCLHLQLASDEHTNASRATRGEVPRVMPRILSRIARIASSTSHAPLPTLQQYP